MIKKFTILIPAYNEEANILNIVNQVEGFFSTIEHELIIINDHSTDSTETLINSLKDKYPNLKLINNPLERGFANALKTGFSQVITPLVIPVMADLCDDLSTIPLMLEKIDAGYDLVCGARYMPGGKRQGGSKLKAFFSWFVGSSLNYLIKIPTHDLPNSFKMYKKEILNKINIEAKSFDISMEITLKTFFLGYKIAQVPTVWQERQQGKSSFKMFKLLPNYLHWYIWGLKENLKTRKR